MVTVIEGATDTVVARIPVTVEPSVLWCNPANNRVYCGHEGSDTVEVIDGLGDTLIARLATGVHPTYPNWPAFCHRTSDNTIYYAYGGAADSVVVIDGTSNCIVGYVPTGRSPSALCFDSLNDKVYCANYDDSSVSVIYCPTNAEILRIDVGRSPGSLTWNPTENRVYVANTSDSTISVLRDSMTGIEERKTPDARRMTPVPTIVSGMLNMPEAGSRQQAEYRAELLDIAGRQVLRLHPGANDVSRLGSGVYFVRYEPPAPSRRPSAVQKIVIQH